MTPTRIKISADGRFFTDQDGRPWFYLADTCWLLFKRATMKELDEYLQDRAAKGFTVIQAYVIRGLGETDPDGNTSLIGAVPFQDRDPNRPNEDFFRHVDEVVARANALGLVMALVTAKSWHVPGGRECCFDEANARTFGAFLGNRYRDRAVMWLPGGDSAPAQADAVWQAMARGLKEGSGGRHLVSYHGDWVTSSSEWYHGADWLDFNTIQSGHTWESDNYAFVSVDRALSPAKPTVDIEPSYENHPVGGRLPIDSHKVRTQAYTAMLAGAAGHGYGALDLFCFFKDADGPFPRGGGGWKELAFQHWRTACAYEGAAQMGLMRKLFETRPWWKLVPGQSLMASYKGEGNQRRTAARAADGSFMLAYLPEGGTVTMRGLDVLTGSEVIASWFDPRTGQWKEAGRFKKTGSLSFEAPTSGEKDDWVLVLDAQPSSRS
ncbi:MAG: glycoside hydrolase family 140 protein [Candidatus Coatesbacteria bacterium]